MAFNLHNTLTRKKEEFVPLDDGKVRMYSCGPTVWDYAHVGNFRAYICVDVLKRYMLYKGSDVIHIMNITDVDDKIIERSVQEKKPFRKITEFYTREFFHDSEQLRIKKADLYPKATEHISHMVRIIQQLMKNGHAYRSEDGSVYYNIASFKDYGKLSHSKISSLKAGARVKQDSYDKENAQDFALWKAWDREDGNVFWETELGKGRPGWHIECSAMSMKYLGESFDLHTGGVDNIFPHHEDEIAQSEAATGKPFCKYWMHCAHLVVDGKKMSKSLGNFYTLRDVTGRGYNGREIRYELMATHYRQSLNFTFEALDGARAALQRLDEFSARLESVAGQTPASGVLPPWAEIAVQKFTASLDDDLNVSGALAAIFDLVRDGNIATNKQELSSADARQVLNQLDRLDAVFGFIRKPAEAVDPEIENLLELRKKARQEKNWAESDRLRSEMASRGWLVQDSAKGQTVKKAH
ncbi:MAG TPA: cysteine--tRNA ligase [Verrucomicrobia bacterium]|nr:cysteine--tRNA ligase [Verrucomicrobiota bacterium]